jgi:hypothetical protein
LLRLFCKQVVDVLDHLLPVGGNSVLGVDLYRACRTFNVSNKIKNTSREAKRGC